MSTARPDICNNLAWVKPPRFTVAIHHGETRSVFYVVDNKAASGWQPEILGSLNDLHGAKGICSKLNQLDRGTDQLPADENALRRELDQITEIREAIHHQSVSDAARTWLACQADEIQNTLDILHGLIDRP